MRWRAWYSGGREFSSAATRWEELPRAGCILVKWWPDEGAKRLECGDDAILRLGDEFCSINLPTEDFAAIASDYADRGALKFGELLPSDEYAALYERALGAEAPPK